jgi:hypothetical protein
MLLSPPDEEGGMTLVFTSGLRQGGPGFDCTPYLQCELTGKAPAFESQGCASFRS